MSAAQRAIHQVPLPLAACLFVCATMPLTGGCSGSAPTTPEQTVTDSASSVDGYVYVPPRTRATRQLLSDREIIVSSAPVAALTEWPAPDGTVVRLDSGQQGVTAGGYYQISQVPVGLRTLTVSAVVGDEALERVIDDVVVAPTVTTHGLDLPDADLRVVIITADGTQVPQGSSIALEAVLLVDGRRSTEFADFIWSSSDASVLSVDRGGQATGLNPGGVTVTAAAGRLASSPSDAVGIEVVDAATAGRECIAFTRVVDGVPRLYSVRPDGTGLAEGTAPPTGAMAPDWSWDANALVVASPTAAGPSALWVRYIAGDTWDRVTSGLVPDERPAWSPDGAHIAFSRSDPQGVRHIYICGPDGSGLRQLTDGTTDDQCPTWDPSGTRVVYARMGEDRDQDLYSVGLDGSAPYPVIASEENEWDPCFSRDGRLLAFSQGDQTRDVEVLVYRIHGDTIENVTQAPGSRDWDPTFSPDGSAIAFVSDRSGYQDIWVQRLDGTGLLNLTDSDASDALPAWSPGPVSRSP